MTRSTDESQLVKGKGVAADTGRRYGACIDEVAKLDVNETDALRGKTGPDKLTPDDMVRKREINRKPTIIVDDLDSADSELTENMDNAPLAVDSDHGKVVTWPRGVKKIPIWERSRVFHMVERDYNTFLRYPEVLHTDSSLEFALRCVAEVNLFQVSDPVRASVSTYTSPFIINGMSQWPQRTGAELAIAAEKVAKACPNIPSELWEDWSCFPLFVAGGKVGHYIFVGLKNLPLLYRTIRFRFDNNEDLSMSFDLAATLQISQPSLIFIDSLSGLGSIDTVESVIKIAGCLFYLMWTFDDSRSSKRPKRHRRKGSKYVDPMSVAFPHIEKFYRSTSAYIQGPSQGFSVKCGSFTITHFVFAQKKDYLDNIIAKAASVHVSHMTTQESLALKSQSSQTVACLVVMMSRRSLTLYWYMLLKCCGSMSRSGESLRYEESG